jgi:S-(hydroxymethyl)glutathione dehydrogenase / alcohol dehydrogenase
MRAAVLEALNAPLRIEDLELPSLRRGQVLVKLTYSGVCRSQLMEVRGGRGQDPYLPHLLGHEGTGVVVETGPGVEKVRAGDLVVLTWIRGAGLDAGGTQYLQGNRTVNAGAVTTFNEMAVVSENRCVRLPPGVPLDEAVLFGCALATGAGMVMNLMRPPAGSTVAVFGLGGVGLCALMALGLFDCSEIIAVDTQDEKLALASELGATRSVNPSREDPLQVIRDHTSGRGADFAVEAAGLAMTIEQAFCSVRQKGGKCFFASHPSRGMQISLDPFDLICGKEIRGTWGGETDPDRDVPVFADHYRAGRLPLDKLTTRRYSLDEINDALADLEAGRVFRCLLDFEEDAAST